MRPPLEATALEATAQGRHQASSLTTRLRTATPTRKVRGTWTPCSEGVGSVPVAAFQVDVN